MFAPKGWMCLSDIFQLVDEIIRDKGRIGPIEFYGDENFEVTWLFLQECENPSICLTNGEALPVSRSIVEMLDPYDNLNNHIDLIAGTVGSAHSERHDNGPIDEFELRLTYGPFLHLPLIFPRDEFFDFLREFDVEPDEFLAQRSVADDAQEPVAAKSPRSISKEIVRLADLSDLPRFEDARKMLGKGLSVRAFRLAWSLASEQRPAISKPGRKPRKKNS